MWGRLIGRYSIDQGAFVDRAGVVGSAAWSKIWQEAGAVASGARRRGPNAPQVVGEIGDLGSRRT